MAPTITPSKVIFQTKINPYLTVWPLELNLIFTELSFNQLTLKELLDLGLIAVSGINSCQQRNNQQQNQQQTLDQKLTLYLGSFGEIYFPVIKKNSSVDEKYFGRDRNADYDQKIRAVISPVVIQSIKFSTGYRAKRNPDNSIQTVFYGQEWESSPGKRWHLYTHLPASCRNDFYLYGQLALELWK